MTKKKPYNPRSLAPVPRERGTVQSLSDNEEAAEERSFMRGVVQGLMDLEKGREMSLPHVKNHLGLK